MNKKAILDTGYVALIIFVIYMGLFVVLFTITSFSASSKANNICEDLGYKYYEKESCTDGARVLKNIVIECEGFFYDIECKATKKEVKDYSDYRGAEWYSKKC